MQIVRKLERKCRECGRELEYIEDVETGMGAIVCWWCQKKKGMVIKRNKS